MLLLKGILLSKNHTDISKSSTENKDIVPRVTLTLVDHSF